MRLTGRRKRRHHARYVGLRPVPEPLSARRRPAKRLAALIGALALVVVAAVTIAGTLAGGSPRSASAADRTSAVAASSHSISPDATIAAARTPVASAATSAAPKELPV